MSDDVIDIGLVTGLDYADPTTDPHDNFQRYKLHPAIRPLLEGGEMIRYGAKAIPEGGLHAMPRFYADGLCIVGDSAGFLNGLRLKGIHLAMKSGMMAAEAIFDAVQADDTSSKKLSAYETKFAGSWARTELHAARNFHQGFSSGMWGGLMNAQLSLMRGGRGFGIKDKLAGEHGYARMKKLSEMTPTQVTKRVVPDGKLTFDKTSSRAARCTMRTSRRTCTCPIPTSARRNARSSTATRASTFARRRSTNRTSPRPATRPRKAVCRSTSRIACTARRATSWTRTRSSPGSHRKAAKAPSTQGCSS
jgi:electron-transferring-flavoprotein dehydrogenase